MSLQQTLDAMLVQTPAPTLEQQDEDPNADSKIVVEDSEPIVSDPERKYQDSRDARHPDLRHPLFDPTPAPAPKMSPHDVMKRAVDSALAMYCDMRDHQDDFYDHEVDAIYNVVEQVVSSFLAKLIVKSSVKLSHDRVDRYLEAYYNLHKLKQAQDRRIQFCSQFEHMFEVGGISNLMQDSAGSFAKSIHAKAREIDKLVEPPSKSSRHTGGVPSLRDLLSRADVSSSGADVSSSGADVSSSGADVSSSGADEYERRYDEHDNPNERERRRRTRPTKSTSHRR